MIRGTKLALASALVLGLSTAPAQAAEDFAYCDPLAPAGAALYSSTGAAGSALGRGDVVREPELGQTHTDMPASAKGRAGRGFRATVPVYFHVITDGATGALTNAQIAAQIQVLNTTFAGGEGGAAAGLRFTLAGVTRTDNAAWFNAKPGGTAEHSMKRALKRGGTDALVERVVVVPQRPPGVVVFGSNRADVDRRLLFRH